MSVKTATLRRADTDATAQPSAASRWICSASEPAGGVDRRTGLAGAAGGGASDADRPDDAADPRPRGEDSDAVREGGRP